MAGSRAAVWVLWAGFAALLALEFAFAYLAPSREHPWYDAQVSVAGFVLALLALITGVGTFTLRESLALREIRAGALDPSTPAGYARVRLMLIVLWTLCLVIGLLGCGLAWGAASPRAALPYLVGAAVLLAFHAPRRRIFEGGG
ncbi:MAG: hypothetical protein ACHQ3O_08415 [Candidatus Limnocylindria bacterium]